MDIGTQINLILEDEFEEGEYWGTQAAGAYIFAEDTGKVLFLLRSSHVYDPNTWGIPSGAIDPGESPEVAVRREATEELGHVGSMSLRKIPEFRDGDFVFHNYIATVPEEFEPTLNWENDDFIWVDLDTDPMPSPLHPGVAGYLVQFSSRMP